MDIRYDADEDSFDDIASEEVEEDEGKSQTKEDASEQHALVPVTTAAGENALALRTNAFAKIQGMLPKLPFILHFSVCHGGIHQSSSHHWICLFCFLPFQRSVLLVLFKAALLITSHPIAGSVASLLTNFPKVPLTNVIGMHSCARWAAANSQLLCHPMLNLTPGNWISSTCGVMPGVIGTR